MAVTLMDRIRDVQAEIESRSLAELAYRYFAQLEAIDALEDPDSDELNRAIVTGPMETASHMWNVPAKTAEDALAALDVLESVEREDVVIRVYWDEQGEILASLRRAARAYLTDVSAIVAR